MVAGEITPGPGWWKAADDEWYPPRWEYMWVRGYIGPQKKYHVDVEAELDELGSQGWEAVSAVSNDANAGLASSAHGVAVLMKRPLRP